MFFCRWCDVKGTRSFYFDGMVSIPVLWQKLIMMLYLDDKKHYTSLYTHNGHFGTKVSLKQIFCQIQQYNSQHSTSSAFSQMKNSAKTISLNCIWECSPRNNTTVVHMLRVNMETKNLEPALFQWPGLTSPNHCDRANPWCEHNPLNEATFSSI